MEAPYRRLAATLRRRIDDGTYSLGSQFPSHRAIAAEHKVGLGTAYQAVAVLRTEGLLDGSPRRRLTVAHPVGVRTLSNPDAAWPPHDRGDTERSTVRATEELAVRLGVRPGVTLQRERTERLDPDGRPAMLLTTWRRGAPRPHDSYRCTVRVRPMEHIEADLLGLRAGTLALLVERTRTDANGTVVETADMVLPADRWSVTL